MKRNYYFLLSTFVVLLFAPEFIRGQQLKERDLPEVSDYYTGSQIGADSIFSHSTSNYPNLIDPLSNWQSKYQYDTIYSRLVLGITHSKTYCYDQDFSLSVLFKVRYNIPDDTITRTIDSVLLNVEYFNDSLRYKDKAVFQFGNAVNIRAKVRDIFIDTGFVYSLQYVPDNVFLYMEIEALRYFSLDPTTQFNLNNITISTPDDGYYTVSWQKIPEADFYELEYLFVNNYSRLAGEINYDFNENSTRIQTNRINYKIANVFEDGYLLVRIRGVAIRKFKDHEIAIKNNWSEPSSGLVSNFTKKVSTSKFEGDAVNWEYQAVFGEWGKKGEQLNFYDGNFKVRQSQVKAQENNETIIGETVYDLFGRPIVDMLPVPSDSSHFFYFNKFNKKAGVDQPLSPFYFYDTSYVCQIEDPGLDTATGAYKYYSSRTDFNDSSHKYDKYLPHSQGVPFTQRMYRNDPTGTVKKVGGAGKKFRISSGQEISYLRGNVSDHELRKYFGGNAGSSGKFLKEAVIDPNGQSTVLIKNKEGRVVATYLSGTKKENLIRLSEQDSGFTEEFLLDKGIGNNLPIGNGYLFYFTYLVSEPGPHKISYGLEYQEYRDSCLLDNICFDCRYFFEFYLLDNECGDTLAGPIIDTIGTIDTSCSGNVVTWFFPGSSSLDSMISVELPIGEYTIVKKLILDKEPISHYSKIYLESNGCLMGWGEFYEKELNKIDSTLCLYDCDACKEEVQRLKDLLASGDTTITQAMINRTDSVCRIFCGEQVDRCEVNYHAMLGDLYPGGQYGAYFDKTYNSIYNRDTNYYVTHFDKEHEIDLSIYNLENKLSHYRAYYGTPYSPYLTGSGVRDSIPDEDGIFRNPEDPNIGIKDFVGNFKMPWAYSLIQYHPEYCQYQYCVETVTSGEFDNSLNFHSTLTAAYKNSLLDSLNLTDTSHVLSLDPFFMKGSPGFRYRSAFGEKLLKYFELKDTIHYVTLNGKTKLLAIDSINLNIWDLSVLLANSEFIPQFSYEIREIRATTRFGEGSAVKRNKEWAYYRYFYSAIKSQYYDSARVSWSIDNKCFNSCFGDPDFDTNFYYHDQSLSWVQEGYDLAGDHQQPCSRKTYALYANVTPRFQDNEKIGDLSLRKYRNKNMDKQIDSVKAIEIDNWCDSMCHSYRHHWKKSLAGCSISDSLLNEILNDFETICNSGCDADNMFGSRNLPPGVAGSPASFKEALETHLGANFESIWCSDLNITSPMKYGHKYFEPEIPKEPDEEEKYCGCEELVKDQVQKYADSTKNYCTGKYIDAQKLKNFLKQISSDGNLITAELNKINLSTSQNYSSYFTNGLEYFIPNTPEYHDGQAITPMAGDIHYYSYFNDSTACDNNTPQRCQEFIIVLSGDSFDCNIYLSRKNGMVVPADNIVRFYNIRPFSTTPLAESKKFRITAVLTDSSQIELEGFSPCTPINYCDCISMEPNWNPGLEFAGRFERCLKDFNLSDCFLKTPNKYAIDEFLNLMDSIIRNQKTQGGDSLDGSPNQFDLGKYFSWYKNTLMGKYEVISGKKVLRSTPLDVQDWVNCIPGDNYWIRDGFGLDTFYRAVIGEAVDLESRTKCKIIFEYLDPLEGYKDSPFGITDIDSLISWRIPGLQYTPYSYQRYRGALTDIDYFYIKARLKDGSEKEFRARTDCIDLWSCDEICDPDVDAVYSTGSNLLCNKISETGKEVGEVLDYLFRNNLVSNGATHDLLTIPAYSSGKYMKEYTDPAHNYSCQISNGNAYLLFGQVTDTCVITLYQHDSILLTAIDSLHSILFDTSKTKEGAIFDLLINVYSGGKIYSVKGFSGCYPFSYCYEQDFGEERSCETCISCEKMRSHLLDFKRQYPRLLVSHTNFSKYFSNYLNLDLGWNLSSAEFEDFIDRCGIWKKERFYFSACDMEISVNNEQDLQNLSIIDSILAEYDSLSEGILSYEVKRKILNGVEDAGYTICLNTSNLAPALEEELYRELSANYTGWADQLDHYMQKEKEVEITLTNDTSLSFDTSRINAINNYISSFETQTGWDCRCTWDTNLVYFDTFSVAPRRSEYRASLSCKLTYFNYYLKDQFINGLEENFGEISGITINKGAYDPDPEICDFEKIPKKNKTGILDECGCDKIIYSNRYYTGTVDKTAPVPPGTNELLYFNSTLNTTLTLTEYQNILEKCDSALTLTGETVYDHQNISWSASALDYIGSLNLTVPSRLSCQECLSCREIDRVIGSALTETQNVLSPDDEIGFIKTEVSKILGTDVEVYTETTINGETGCSSCFLKEDTFFVCKTDSMKLKHIEYLLKELTLLDSNNMKIYLSDSFIFNSFYTSSSTCRPYAKIKEITPKIYEIFIMDNCQYFEKIVVEISGSVTWYDFRDAGFLTALKGSGKKFEFYGTYGVDGLMLATANFSHTSIRECCEIAPHVLCNKLLPPTKQSNPCLDMKKENAKVRASILYTSYIDSVIKSFKTVYVSHCLDTSANLTEQLKTRYPYRQGAVTLYYYDRAGNLVQTVPPKGVKTLTITAPVKDSINKYQGGNSAYFNEPNHTYRSKYQYNSHNSVVKQETPDGGETEFWYDEAGRLILSRNARQLAEEKFSYTTYDSLGRISEVGELTYSNLNILSQTLTSSHTILYSNFLVWLSGQSRAAITSIHYDYPVNSSVNAYFGGGQQNLRSRVASILFKENQGDDFTFATHYSYDIHGNVQELVQENRKLKGLREHLKKIYYEYELITGNIKELWYQRGEPDQYIHRYRYDKDNRLVTVQTSRDNVIWDDEAEYAYYRHGALARNELGDLRVQGLDYAYTLQGWLKSINSTTLQPSRDMGRDGFKGGMEENTAYDVFGMELGYYQGDYKPIGGDRSHLTKLTGSKTQMTDKQADLFNGNISRWTSANAKFLSDGGPVTQFFRYDQLNRLREATFMQGIDTVNNTWNNLLSVSEKYRTKYEYDPNGNITKLFRNAHKGAGEIAMDSLTYTYEGGTNKLLQVKDDITGHRYEPDIDDQGLNNYSYDALGNLTADASEEIQAIDWNPYGKISKITRTAGSKKPDLIFSYDASGNRVEKVAKYGSLPLTWNHTYYARDAQGNILAIYEKKIMDSISIDTSQYGWMVDSLKNRKTLYELGEFFVNMYGNGTFANQLKNGLKNKGLLDDVVRLGLSYYEGIPGFKEYLLKSIDAAEFIDSVVVLDRTKFNFLDRNTLILQSVMTYCYRTLTEVENINPGLIDNMHINLVVNKGCGTTADKKQDICGCVNTTPGEIANMITANLASQDLDTILYSGLTDTEFSGVLHAHYSDNDLRDQVLDLHFNDVYNLFNRNSLTGYYTALTDDELFNFIVDHDMAKFIRDGINQNYTAGTYALKQVEPEGRYFLENVNRYFGAETYEWLRGKFPYDDLYERLVLKEVELYGSDRLGAYKPDERIKGKKFTGSVDASGNFQADSVQYVDSLVMADQYFSRTLGKKQYEIKDHLGNVRAVVTDKKRAVYDATACGIDHFETDIVAAYDYYPFGMIMPGRSFDLTDSSIAGEDTCVTSTSVYGILDDFVTEKGASSLSDNTLLASYVNSKLKIKEGVGSTVPKLKSEYYLEDTLDFNGSAYIDYGIKNQYKFGTGDFSVETWFYLPTGLAGGNYTIISNAKFDGTDTYEGGFELTLNTNNNAINFTLNDGAATWNNSKGVARCFFTPGQWYHLVVVRVGNDVNNWKMYLNGVSQTVTVNTNTLLNGDISNGTDENLKIGTRLNGHPSAPGYFNGSIKNVRLYARALGASEVSANYNDNCDKAPSSTADMVFWAKLDKGEGTTVNDYSSFGETGTFTGTGLTWGRKIREDGCTDASTCFEQVSARYYAGGQARGFQGMLRNDEIAGSGNSYTAEFWQYDPRTGRRWNLDPVIAPWESPYAAFRNNPIYYIDPNGDCPDCGEGEKGDSHTDKNGKNWRHDGDNWIPEPHKEIVVTGERGTPNSSGKTSTQKISTPAGMSKREKELYIHFVSSGGPIGRNLLFNYSDERPPYSLVTGNGGSIRWTGIEPPLSEWGEGFQEFQFYTSMALTGVIAAPFVTSTLIEPVVSSGIGLYPAVQEGVLTLTVHATIRLQILTRTLSGMGSSGILLGRYMRDYVKPTAIYHGLGYLRMPQLIQNMGTHHQLLYNGLWLKYHYGRGAQFLLLTNRYVGHSSFMQLELLMMKARAINPLLVQPVTK